MTAVATAIIHIPPRQRLTLELVADGHTDDQIAELMGVKRSTVIKQVELVRDRLGARNRAHAVAIAIRRGYIL